MRIKQLDFSPVGAGLKHAFYTMRHPVLGFDDVKWQKKGSVAACAVILFFFFLTNVFDQMLTGFMYNRFNTDRISIPSILLITLGGFAIVYLANWAAGSLVFSEGETRDIFILFCYVLVPYILADWIFIFLTNVANLELAPFLAAVKLIGYLWSSLLLIIGLITVHQFSFGQMLLNLFLTVAGIAVVLFLLLLGYSLVQQIMTFVRTIYNEIVFRL